MCQRRCPRVEDHSKIISRDRDYDVRKPLGRAFNATVSVSHSSTQRLSSLKRHRSSHRQESLWSTILPSPTAIDHFAAHRYAPLIIYRDGVKVLNYNRNPTSPRLTVLACFKYRRLEIFTIPLAPQPFSSGVNAIALGKDICGVY